MKKEPKRSSGREAEPRKGVPRILPGKAPKGPRNRYMEAWSLESGSTTVKWLYFSESLREIEAGSAL